MNKTDSPETLPVELPRWLEDVLPPHSDPQVLTTVLVDGVRLLRLVDPDGTVADFTTVESMGESQRGSNFDLSIDTEVYEHFSEKRRGHLSYPAKNGYVSVIFSRTDEDRRRSLETSYLGSLEDQKSYAENPRDFLAAWRFIDSHPAFWTCIDLNLHPWHWETQGYCSKLRQGVTERDGKGYRIYLEAGGHVERSTTPGRPAFKEHYADWRLEVVGSSFEEAILELAFRVSKAFDSEGNSLDEEGFPYRAPEWVEDLKQILDGHDS